MKSYSEYMGVSNLPTHYAVYGYIKMKEIVIVSGIVLYILF